MPELDLDYSVSFREAKEQVVARWERAWIEGLVRRHSGNLSRAARSVSMDRNHLRELAKRHGVEIRASNGELRAANSELGPASESGLDGDQRH